MNADLNSIDPFNFLFEDETGKEITLFNQYFLFFNVLNSIDLSKKLDSHILLNFPQIDFRYWSIY